MRLIDADMILKEKIKSKYYHLPNGDIAVPLIDIEHAPTITPPTGTWEEKEILSLEDSKAIEQWQSAKCSVCGHYHTIPYLYSFHESNFCPHCGARNGGKT